MKKESKGTNADMPVAACTTQAAAAVDPNVITWPEAPAGSDLNKRFFFELDQKKAFETENKCIIVREYSKVPPQNFQDIVIKEASTYHAIRKPRFIKNILVAEWLGDRTNLMTESLISMLDGLERGYKAALGPCKPYSITYTEVALKPAFAREFAGKTEREVFEALNLDYYRDTLPDHIFKKKVVTEYFETHREAHDRTDVLYGHVTDPKFPQPESKDNWSIKYDQTKQYWF